MWGLLPENPKARASSCPGEGRKGVCCERGESVLGGRESCSAETCIPIMSCQPGEIGPAVESRLAYLWREHQEGLSPSPRSPQITESGLQDDFFAGVAGLETLRFNCCQLKLPGLLGSLLHLDRVRSLSLECLDAPSLPVGLGALTLLEVLKLDRLPRV